MSSEATGASPPTSKKEHSRKESESTAASKEPIIVDMGKKSRKAIRKLRKGKAGSLMDRVEETLAHLRENGAFSGGVQPVVFVVKQRTKRRGRHIAKMWGLG